MNTKNNLSYDNFLELVVANISNKTSAETIKKYLKAIYAVILRPLEINNSIYIKDFGTFKIKERKGLSKVINNPTNNERYITYIKPKTVVQFQPAKAFEYSVNEGNFKVPRDNTDKKLNKKKRKSYHRKNRKRETFADLLNIANERKDK